MATRKKSITTREKGRIYINASFNNTLITLTDERGNVLSSCSAGRLGYKGTKKATPFAASQAARKTLELGAPYQVKNVSIFVSGVGSGRDAAVRAIGSSGLAVTAIKDITPVPHNGPRAKKSRRV